jgi:uncharacterized protein with GYD domain
MIGPLNVHRGQTRSPEPEEFRRVVAPPAVRYGHRLVLEVPGVSRRDKGAVAMPTFVSLTNWTDQGVANVKDTIRRSDDAKRAATAMGGTIREILWTVGPYDLVVLADFPDDATATAFLLALGSSGNVRTTTMHAFSADEMSQVIGKLG